MKASDRPIRTFDPLLRDLIAWGLVHGDGDSWELSEQAQLRLAELATTSGAPPAEQRVYMNHRCHRCNGHGLTRLRDGVYVCDTCWSTPDVVPVTVAAASVPKRRLALRKAGAA